MVVVLAFLCDHKKGGWVPAKKLFFWFSFVTTRKAGYQQKEHDAPKEVSVGPNPAGNSGFSSSPSRIWVLVEVSENLRLHVAQFYPKEARRLFKWLVFVGFPLDLWMVLKGNPQMICSFFGCQPGQEIGVFVICLNGWFLSIIFGIANLQ